MGGQVMAAVAAVAEAVAAVPSAAVAAAVAAAAAPLLRCEATNSRLSWEEHRSEGGAPYWVCYYY